MRTTRLQWLSVILFMAVSVFLIAFGLLYANAPWAAAFVAATYWIAFGVAGYTAVRLNELTGAPVAWYNMAILSAITALAFAAHALARITPDRHR
jgi:hypothetical protein